MKLDFEITNLDMVIRDIEEALTDDLRPGLEKACALVERTAKEKAPKDTGALRRSITSEVREENGDLIGVVFTPLEYAPYVEYGTGKWAEGGNGRKDVPWSYEDDEGEWHTTYGQKPQPFMRPALNENREKILRLLAREI